MKFRTKIEAITGSVGYTDVAYMNLKSLGGPKYFVTFIDVATVYVRVAHLHKKGEAEIHFQEHMRWAERQTAKPVKRIVLDGDKEYMNAEEDSKHMESRKKKSCVYSKRECTIRAHESYYHKRNASNEYYEWSTVN